MAEQQKPRVLIVGAGSMGIVLGWILTQGGAEVTFLVRPLRAQALSRPHVLYSYNDNQLKTFKDFKYITDHSDMGAKYDYIVITLDGAALKNEDGRKLCKSIGYAAKGTNTKIVLGSIHFDLRSWFLETSGLDSEQVTNGMFFIHIYPTKAVNLPTKPPTDEKLIAQADQAYSDSLGPGFVLDDSSPAVAKEFTELYNASGVSSAIVMSVPDLAVFTAALYPLLAVNDLLGYQKYSNIDSKSEEWKLLVRVAKEILSLDTYGEAGKKATAAITAEGLLAQGLDMEQKFGPFDVQEFNRYHHGGKVNLQDREILHEVLSRGEAEGKALPALKELVQRVDQLHA